MKDRFIAFDYTTHEFHTFPTREEAVQWVMEIDISGDDGVSDEIQSGMAGIAKIEQVTKFVIDETRDDYKDPDEEWPYNSDWDYVGHVELEDLKEDQAPFSRSFNRKVLKSYSECVGAGDTFIDPTGLFPGFWSEIAEYFTHE